MSDTEIARDMFLFSNAPAARPEAGTRAELRLIEDLKSGDQEAFNELYRMFAPMVHAVILVRVPYEDVPDIVQEVFITAFEKLDTLRDPAAFGGWLAKIARNRATEFYRSRRPSEELSEDFRGPANVSAEAMEILDAIRSLQETYREILALRLIEGMTGAEIADRTGLTHDSVRVKLHRGMALLRETLGIKGKRK